MRFSFCLTELEGLGDGTHYNIIREDCEDWWGIMGPIRLIRQLGELGGLGGLMGG